MHLVMESLRDAVGVFQSLEALVPELGDAIELCLETFRQGRKLLICGNGGSAAEAQHLAGELVGRYRQHDRAPLPAVALTADTAILTCIGNDYRFEDLFARQVRGLGCLGDVLVAFTTSGDSPNVIEALGAARAMDLKSICFLGRDGGRARHLSDCCLTVPHWDTARIQEAHQFLLHCLMDGIEAGLAAEPGHTRTARGV
jgi:D-sedoheptulose 7-phosphate isomerase